MSEPTYGLELINLGRCLQDPNVLKEFTTDDWYYEEHRNLFIDLTTLPTRSQKRDRLSEYLKRFGVDPFWVSQEPEITAGEACTKSQRINVLEQEIATHTLYLLEDLRERRTMGSKERILNHIDRLKEMVQQESVHRNVSDEG